MCTAGNRDNKNRWFRVSAKYCCPDSQTVVSGYEDCLNTVAKKVGFGKATNDSDENSVRSQLGP